MNASKVLVERLLVSKGVITMLTSEWLQVDMVLIMNDQACARCERLTANFMSFTLVTRLVQALVVCNSFLVDLVHHCNFLVRIFWQNLEPGVKFTTANRLLLSI